MTFTFFLDARRARGLETEERERERGDLLRTKESLASSSSEAPAALVPRSLAAPSACLSPEIK